MEPLIYKSKLPIQFYVIVEAVFLGAFLIVGFTGILLFNLIFFVTFLTDIKYVVFHESYIDVRQSLVHKTKRIKYAEISSLTVRTGKGYYDVLKVGILHSSSKKYKFYYSKGEQWDKLLLFLEDKNITINHA